ncbi:prolyl-tRNA synthetase associated domain-containing protein [Xanthobacter sp. TB0139]|uniref:prolyl-tRNA synthetase associated domain-containing protein n=1 Tax=Xanthobacter sp. TB0139 TaxID=3459178 RepID=UPI00403929E1
MPLTADALLALLAENDIPAETFHHPPLHTVEESKALRGVIPGVQTKNLFLRDGKKNLYLVTLAEDAVLNLKSLRAPLGARGGLSFASANLLMEHLGVMPGSVTLLALVNDAEKRVRVVLDASLMQADAVGCHPLTNERTTVLSPAALSAFFSLTGHEPVMLDLDALLTVTEAEKQNAAG